MHKLNKWIKYPLYILLSFGILFIILFIYLAAVALVAPPVPNDLSSLSLNPTQLDTNCLVIGNNWIRKSNSGLWEMYVEGEPFERGVINGKLAKQLIFKQEDAFNDQICKLVPSAFYRNFLKYLIAWFNRDLDKNIIEEYKLEIYGVSKSASPKFDYIGPAYQRLMNYHAAHDIGHALQNFALVGCSSFGTWNEKSKDSTLIIGRNFDFYVGDKFAEDKIVMFVNPKRGYKFMMVTWGGMIGVISGMNMQGLTLTLNAAKSTIPNGSATPVSLLAREILQYARNIDDAVKIAHKRKTFVSESFLIGSTYDNKAVNIEVTPDTVDVYDPKQNQIVCTNHYEGPVLGKTDINKKQMQESASVYREDRILELLNNIISNTPEKTVAILRNQYGLHNKFIGYGNEKAVNQLISHHSIVFEPKKKLVWVSTSPWQLGPYIAYDLNKIFAIKGLKTNQEVNDTSLTIPADPFLKTTAFQNFIEFKKIQLDLSNGKEINPDKLIQLNPEYYHAYVLTGDYVFKRKYFTKAKSYYEKALTKEIATFHESQYIKNQIAKCTNELRKIN